MTMALLAPEEIVNRQQDQGTTVVCRSQTAPITHLEPATQTAGGKWSRWSSGRPQAAGTEERWPRQSRQSSRLFAQIPPC